LLVCSERKSGREKEIKGLRGIKRVARLMMLGSLGDRTLYTS
jgi:hypothetical protein